MYSLRKLWMYRLVMTDFRSNFSKKRIKFCILSIISFIILNEYLVYVFMPWIQWPSLEKSSIDSVKLLLVGDPQLLGERFTSFSIFGFLARWDSDRFISKTFHLAYDYINPDIIIFLGDNLDEGEIATDEEFQRYFQRFKNVFHSIDFNKVIIIPGDNDIGGENDSPSIDNEKRFDKYFKNDIYIRYRFLEFVKVNYMTQSNNFLPVASSSEKYFRIVISHMPLIPMFSGFAEKVFVHLQPHLIFSAHEHNSNHFTAIRKTGIRTHSEMFFQNEMLVLNITDADTQEIMVPSCSYRMGTDKMGYGALIISESGQMIYGVLWLPSRFQQLFFYLGLCLLTILVFVPVRIWSCLDTIFFHRKTFLPLYEKGNSKLCKVQKKFQTVF